MARESKRRRDEKRFGKADRIIDLYSRETLAVPPWCEKHILGDHGLRKDYGSTYQAVSAALGMCKLIVADNVAEFLYANNPKEDWAWPTDFPSCVPPFEAQFIEFGRPSRILSEGRILSAQNMPDRIGWLIRCRNVEGSPAEKTARQIALNNITELMDAIHAPGSPDPSDTTPGFAELAARHAQLSSGEPLGESFPGSAKWYVTALLIRASFGRVDIPSICSFIVEKSGAIFQYPIVGIIGGKYIAPDDQKVLVNQFCSMLHPALLAISFMNCKNVAIESVEPDVELNRERRKNGKKPFLRYHTINIEPMKTVLRSEGGIEANGLQRALHICRGHFATYTDTFLGRTLSEPMTVWRPSHVRGSAKEGVIVSDYNVKSPKNAEPTP